jgi:NADH-quinone oxidoreductase subunit H
VTGWLLMIIGGGYTVAVLERWITTRRLSLFSPLFSGVYKLAQQGSLPAQRDKIFLELAPPLFLVAAITATAVLPLTHSVVLVNLATGALFVNAMLIYVAVALVMAGWAPNRQYALIGGWRFLAQMIAYSMPIVMAITAVAMRASSLSLVTIVNSQRGLWNVLYEPLGFALFMLSAMALAFLPPFDLPQAETELEGGVFGNYSGWRLGTTRLARLILIWVMAWAVAVFYLGGWLGPVLPGWLWSVLKTLAVAAAFLFGGRLTARISTDRLLAVAWKVMIPLALVNIFITGLLLLTVKT